jgi:hypothetical protein
VDQARGDQPSCELLVLLPGSDELANDQVVGFQAEATTGRGSWGVQHNEPLLPAWREYEGSALSADR